MLEILVLADDLTGALEAGSAFAQTGLSTVVSLNGQQAPPASVLVIDTETRHMPEKDAAALVTELVSRYPARLLYKKTDSTLRGNIRAELEALSAFGPLRYVPAYPQMGRVVVNGCLHVHGVPLHETEFARDALNPVRDGNLHRLLGDAPGISILEASTDLEISAVAREWVVEGGIAAGPTAFAHHAAQHLGASSGSERPIPSLGRALVAVGSRHPQSRRQVSYAAQQIEKAGWVVVRSPDKVEQDPLPFASAFGQHVAEKVSSGGFESLIVFGGDTARAILEAMGVAVVMPLGEILPGMPVSQLPNGMTLVTKAGGFGAEDALLRMLK